MGLDEMEGRDIGRVRECGCVSIGMHDRRYEI